jgi:hypothetical protein
VLELGAWLHGRGWRNQPVSEASARLFAPARGFASELLTRRERRMWEIVRAEKNLAQALDNALNKTQSPLILANEVVEIAAFLVRAVRAFQQYTIPLEIRLDSIGQIAKQPVYLGFLSCDNSAVQTGTNTDSDIDLLIRSQFGGPISRALIKQNINVPHILRAMQHLKNTDAVESATIETLSALFIGQ